MLAKQLPFFISLICLAIYFRYEVHVVNDDNTWPCSKKNSIERFEKQNWLNPFKVLATDPYEDSEKSAKFINETLQNNDLFCALAFSDQQRNNYILKEFSSKKLAEEENFHVTHQGRCGHCSSTQDLAIYLSKNLTNPVRRCTFLTWLSKTLTVKCLTNLGFTEQCAAVWYYNANHTRKRCFSVCIISLLLGEPNNKPDGTLNDCLQCDEDHSGPVFKYFAGRTRRNSGIASAIDRPGYEIYNITHCYV